jgi:hypothetical protein
LGDEWFNNGVAVFVVGFLCCCECLPYFR